MPNCVVSRRFLPAWMPVALGCGVFGLLGPAQAQTALLPLPVAASAADILPAGTQLPVRLNESLNSKTARVGQTVSYVVARDIRAGNSLVIPAGTTAAGTVAASHGSGAFGLAGTLRLTCDILTLPDGRRVGVRLVEAIGEHGPSRAGTAETTGGLVGLAVGGATYAAVDVGTNLFKSHPDRTGPALAGVGAGLASGFLIGSLFHGGDAHLEAGHPFTLVLTQDVSPSAPSP